MDSNIIKLKNCDPNLVNEVIEAGGTNAQMCFSCGTCTGGCPAIYAMDYTPRQIIRMVDLGIKDKIFKSNTIWICAGCHTCSLRCPRGVEVSKVMSALKSIAIKHGYGADDDPSGPAWYKSFSEVTMRYGRIFEPELMLLFNIKKSKNPIELIRSMLKDAPLGIKMLKKGKLSLLPEKIKGKSHMKIIYENIKRIKAEEDVCSVYLNKLK